MIETIDFSKSEQYTLSIRLSADGFSFSVFNPLGEGELSFFDRKVEESLSLTANLKQTFRDVEWLKHPYRRVNILMSNISPAKVAWATAGKCTCICGKMPPTCIATTAITYCLPTLLNANRQRTASITYYIYGSNSALNRNVTKCTSPVNCPTKKLCSVNYENSSGRYSS